VSLPARIAAVLAANLVLWTGAWLAFATPAGTDAIAAVRDAGRSAGALSAQPELGEVLDFSRLSPVQAYSRPLFDPSRRAWEPPVPEPEPLEPAEEVMEPVAPSMPAPAVKLVGVSELGASDIRALVQLDEYPEPVWVIVGDELMGWTVGRIDGQSITIERGQDRVSFDLYPEHAADQSDQ